MKLLRNLFSSDMYHQAQKQVDVWKREQRIMFQESELRKKQEKMTDEQDNQRLLDHRQRELDAITERLVGIKVEADLVEKDINRGAARRQEIVDLQNMVAGLKVEAEREKYIGIIAEKDKTAEILKAQMEVLTTMILDKVPNVKLEDIFKTVNVNVDVKAPENRKQD